MHLPSSTAEMPARLRSRMDAQLSSGQINREAIKSLDTSGQMIESYRAQAETGAISYELYERLRTLLSQ